MLFLELFLVLLAAFGLAALIWLAAGRLLLPVSCPVRAMLTGTGRGGELEQAVKGLLWLQKSGLWQGVVVITDGGLDAQGLAVARALAGLDGVEFAE